MTHVPLPIHRRLIAALTLFAALSWAACDSLEVADPNAPAFDEVSIQNLVVGTEGGMRVAIGIYLRVVGALGRETYYFEPADPRYTGELYTGPLDPNGFLLTNSWAARYAVVKNATTLLERSSASVELSTAQKAGVDGFAKTIIAYQLSLNLNLTDENGVKIAFNDDVNTPFVSKTDALAEIARYLDEAVGDLDRAGAAFVFTLSPGFEGFNTPARFRRFNRALRARVALYQNDLPTVLSALAESFVDAGADMNLGVYHAFSAASGDRTNPMFEVPTSPSVKLRAHPDFKANAEPDDRRYERKVLDRSGEAGFNPSPSAAAGLSSALVATVAGGSSASYPIIRNEELLLIRAEANIGRGNLEAAEQDVNAVRAAAGLGPVTLDAGSAIDQILHERFYSLFAEGHRWVDVRRLGRINALPNDRPTDQIFARFPRPLDEVPEGT